MPVINGKEVEFREKLPAGRWWGILPRLVNLDKEANILEQLDWDAVVGIIRGTVKAWEFGGDPDSPEDIAELDMFSELIPLIQAIANMIAERTAGLGEAG